MAGLPDKNQTARAFAFSWKDAAGALWQTSPAPGWCTSKVLRYSGPILRAGVQVGVVSRRVNRDTQDRLCVEHLTIEIDESLRGAGFANAYWTHSLDEYANHNVDLLLFNADEDGRTFWARPRVRFTDPEFPSVMLSKWAVRGHNGAGQDAFSQAAARLGLSLAAVQALTQQASTQPATLTPAGLYASVEGRLLLQGAPWKGMVQI